jgi:transcription antitermination factor NusG
MSIAKKQPFINHLDETEPRWFAVHTRSKSEKFAQRMLEKKRIHAWVPLQKLLRRWGRVTRWTEQPLINCYVFVKIVKSEYLPVLETENVAGFVRFKQDLIAIPESEIDILKRITLEDDLEVSVMPGYFSEGDPVEISKGNLLGLKGKIVKIEGKQKVLIELLHIGYSLLITVDTAFLHRIPQHKVVS